MTEVQNNGAAQTNKEVKPDSTGTKTLKGFILWGIVLGGYFLFCFNWMIMDNMKGTAGVNGWYGSFFGDGATIPGIVEQAPNWTLTFMRGVGAFLAGWVLVKIGHKYAVTIAISLLAFGGILGPMVGLLGKPEAGESLYGLFVLFLILRMVMAVGATTLIVYTQPVIATYFNEGQKKTTNLFNALAFNVGSIFAIAFLTYGLKAQILSHWVLFTSGVSCIAIVLLILWVVLAEPIATPDDPNDTATYGSVLAEKRTWMYAIMFGLWLTWVVLYLTMVPGHFLSVINPANGAAGTWKIMFLAGLFGGIPLFNWLASKDWARKPIAMGAILIGVALTIITALIGAYLVGESSQFSSETPFWLFMFYLTSFLAGIAAWGVQGYMLGTTYLYKGATPKKQGIVIGACWGIGYMGETLITILLSPVALNGWAFFALFLIASIGTAVRWLFIPETSGKNPHPESRNA